MKRTIRLYALAALPLAACGDSPTAPGEHELAGSEQDIVAYMPAVDDVDARILSTGRDEPLMQRLSTLLSEIKEALDRREPHRAEEAVGDARALLGACDDDCLIAQERSVIELTLDHAARLIGP